jgi:hypothetical protein
METVFRLAISGQPGPHLPALGIIRCIEALFLLFIAHRFEKNSNAIGLSRSKLLPGLAKRLG